MPEDRLVDNRSPREKFLEEFMAGLRVGDIQQLVETVIIASTELTGIPNNYGKKGDATYDSLTEQVTDMFNQYYEGDEARVIVSLGDMGTSRLQLVYQNSKLIAEPTSESSQRVKNTWNQ